MAAVIGFALIKSAGPNSSASAMFNLSLTALSTLNKPTPKDGCHQQEAIKPEVH